MATDECVTTFDGKLEPPIDLVRAVFANMTERVHKVNEANGWYEADRTVGDGMALLHEEVSEAYREWRKHGFADTSAHGVMCPVYHQPNPGACTCPDGSYKPEGYGSELADILIRLLDQAERDDVDLVGEFERKLAYNATRGYKHGGRRT